VIGFLRPALLLLLIPVLLAWWTTRPKGRVAAGLRLLSLVLLVAALALPSARLVHSGRDLVFLVDRSRSMPPQAEARALELIRLAQSEARGGDRVGVVAFGEEAGLERLPNGSGDPFRAFERELNQDATDLSSALRAGLALIPSGRHGALLVLSDGESTAADPSDAARRAFARDIQIHVLPIMRDHGADLSVERIELPTEVSVGEPFQFSVWVRADQRTEASFALKRGDKLLSSGERIFEPGLNRVLFRDVLLEPGIATFDVALNDVAQGNVADVRPENNAAIGALRARGERRLLVLNDDGSNSPFVRALRSAGLPVEVTTPEDVVLDAISLARWRAVVLENVSAARLGPDALKAIREHVLERGAGLLMTGGKASFGVGGYHLSAVDELLPVSMEQRQEHRKQGVAIAFVLDTSGSMGAVADPTTGTTKMSLANAGTMEAIGLLSSLDAVSVIAVDSAPTVVVPLSPGGDPVAVAERVSGIQAGGGGIYVYTGLMAAAQVLDRAQQANRHIVLFADAADAEEQAGVPDLVKRFSEMGTTVSVIALGTESDSDAAFLKDLARDAGGEAYFTTSPEELPLLFAQDTLTIARSTFIDQPVGVAVLQDVVSLGRLNLSGWPDVGGYNLNYLRPGAFAAAATTDEYRAPILSFWYQGVGRVAAYTGQIGGTYGADFVAWDRFAETSVTLTRWLMGQEEPESLFADVRREGREAVISVEVDSDAEDPPDTSGMTARVQQADGSWGEFVLERVGADRYEARVPLRPEGVTLGTIRLGDGQDGGPDQARVIELPPIALPYSPEFERTPDADRGMRLLRRLAQDSGGIVDPSASEFFSGQRRGRAGRVFSRELILAALCLLLFEVAVRRLSLFSNFSFGRLWNSLARLRLARRSRAKDTGNAPTTAATSHPAPPSPEISSAPEKRGAASESRRKAEGADEFGDALSEARRRAQRKTRR
jgi:Mg-chelatase subunit ChlD